MVSSVPAQAVPQKRRGNDPISWYLQNIGKVPLLTPAEEIELGNQVQKMMVLTEDGQLTEKTKDFTIQQKRTIKIGRRAKFEDADRLTSSKIIFSSGKTVVNSAFLLEKKLGKQWLEYLDQIKLLSIGPQTTKKCNKIFGRVDSQAQEYTFEGLLDVAINIFS